MSHFAKVEDGVVTQVIVAEADHVATLDGTWVKTSYNMSGGIYKAPDVDQSVINGDEARERKNYAGIGYYYDGVGFRKLQPFNSWTLNTSSYIWEPPVAHPDDGKEYTWNEENLAWEER